MAMRCQREGTARVCTMSNSEMPCTSLLSSPPNAIARIARQNASPQNVETSSTVLRAETGTFLRVSSQPMSGGTVPTSLQPSIQRSDVPRSMTNLANRSSGTNASHPMSTNWNIFGSATRRSSASASPVRSVQVRRGPVAPASRGRIDAGPDGRESLPSTPLPGSTARKSICRRSAAHPSVTRGHDSSPTSSSSFPPSLPAALPPSFPL